ncbi:MAG TPA: M10 family metallopeptidase C-terminal domain-containing protein [Sphingomicrobium sp.]|nr:M10 family metallopeptidase C-terminal domain-containing protein [Sphingomicrobium sp.]
MIRDRHLGLFDGYSRAFSDIQLFRKATDAFVPDGVGGELKASPLSTILILSPDNVPDNIVTTSSVEVDGAHIISTINTIGDQDFYRVELEGGRTYDIGEYLVVAGPSGVPLSDAYLEIYDANGNLLQSEDGGGPNTPSGLDALMTFMPEDSGTYYINARAFDQDGTNGTTGDAVGDYELFVTDVTDQPHYVPYYDVDSPLNSIDWGTQVDRTSRNPDGEEGPRPTGNAYTGVGWNPYGIEGKNVISVYFAKTGEIFIDEDPTTPGSTDTMVARGLVEWEYDAFWNALHLYEQVADVVFVEVDSRAEADFKIITYNGTPGAGASLLGRMSPPGEENEGQAEFNAGDVRWTEEGLQPGGFYFPTLIHELGHGMGMAHPHDDGGHSSIMRGAGGGTAGIGGGLGDYNLSQQVFTVMSYNDGWQTSPYGMPRSGGLTGTEVDHFGWVASLSPLDIAVIQDKYGVNEDTATGDDSYVLKDVNAAGTFYSSIWDSAGTDEIVYGGARDASIDLRPATLQYEEGGGGWVSYAYGIYGGFTIANGVTIENARSGSGNDVLIGNDAANVLSSGAGGDRLTGNGGDDVLIGGAGTDTLTGGAGADTFRFDSLADSSVGTGRDVIADFVHGSDKIDFGALGASTFVGNAAFSGAAGEVRAASFTGTTIVEVDSDGDGSADLQVELAGAVSLDSRDFVDLVGAASGAGDSLYGTAGADSISGLGGNDTMFGFGGDDFLDGGSGNDVLVGGSGRDELTGGGGLDRFRFDSVSDSASGAADRIVDFQQGFDRIDVSDLGLTFMGRAKFSGSSGELHYLRSHDYTLVEADLNGDQIADFQIELDGALRLGTTDFLL